MSKSRNKFYVEEVCNFLQHLGYKDAIVIENSYGSDIEVTSLGEKIQIFDGGWDQDQSIHIFLGYEREDGLYWRLLDCNTVILVTPNRFHIMSSKSLLELILSNKWHRTNRVPARKNKEVILIKVRIPWIVWTLPELRTFNRPTSKDEEEALPDPYFEFSPINWEEYGVI